MLATAALVLALSSPQASSVDPPVTTVAEQNQPPEQPAAESQNAEQQTPLHDQHQTDDQRAADKKPPTPPHTGIRALVSNLVEDVKHLPTMQNLMYLSDVVFGAALGSIAGRTVVHHASDYWAIVPAAIPGGGAILVTLNR
jgi:hypothetical protein